MATAVTDYYPELAALVPDEVRCDMAREFLNALGRALPWNRFGRVPVASSSPSLRRKARDVVRAVAAGEYVFLSPSPAHEYLLGRLGRDISPTAQQLFRFLCLSEAVSRDWLVGLVGPAMIDRCLSTQLMLQRGEVVVLSVALIPYGNRAYFAEPWFAINNRQQYAYSPVHIAALTHEHIGFLTRFLAGTVCERMLEMGSGIGIVSLELRPFARKRVGAELSSRSVAFAIANARFHNDSAATFVQSDLFAGVEGSFDLILFNPWTPSEQFIDLILRFIAELPPFLAENGRAVLFLNCRQEQGQDVVLERVAACLRQHALRAKRFVISSCFSGAGRDEVSAVSALCIRTTRWADAEASKLGVISPPIEPVFTRALVGMRLRERFARWKRTELRTRAS
jgi:SAM-dependent methyltransferase